MTNSDTEPGENSLSLHWTMKIEIKEKNQSSEMGEEKLLEGLQKRLKFLIPL